MKGEYERSPQLSRDRKRIWFICVNCHRQKSNGGNSLADFQVQLYSRNYIKYNFLTLMLIFIEILGPRPSAPLPGDAGIYAQTRQKLYHFCSKYGPLQCNLQSFRS